MNKNKKRLGSGKSSLLYSLIGEMKYLEQDNPSINLQGNVYHVS